VSHKVARPTVGILMLLGVVGANAQAPARSFDAEVATYYKLSDGRVISTVGHIYNDSGRGVVRQDSDLGAIITNVKAHTVTLLNFATKEAVVYRLNAAPSLPPPRIGAVKGGRTSVEGHEATKSVSIGPKGERHEVWTAPDIGAVVFSRSEAPSMTTTRYLRRIAVREADPSLFTIPPGYSISKSDLPGGVDPLKVLDRLPDTARGRGRGR